MEDWSSDAVKALKLRLVRPKEDVAALPEEDQHLVKDFSPTFVYPIFGTEETIFGYRDLQVQLYFSSSSLQQYLHITSSATYPTSTTVTPDDPEKILYDFIPPTYLKQFSAFEAHVEKDHTTFTPPGSSIGGYRSKPQSKGKGKGKANGSGSGGGTGLPERRFEEFKKGEEGELEEGEVVYEAFTARWDTEGFKEYHRKMQIFVLLYIEGAQYIDEDDDRWEFITLFEKRKSGGVVSHHFMGFVSFYSFFCWPDTKRLRLAQFVILPPYHRKGHGSALYDLAYNFILTRPEISELTVEDPSEAFEDMRDKSDLFTLLSNKALDGLKAPYTRTETEKIRKSWKLADRQFYRLLEMYFLLTLPSPSLSPTTDEIKTYREFRLVVKKRLYIFNKDMLSQLEGEERKEKLQETFEGVEEDYKRLTKGFEVA